jgi:hypothetical protein
MAYSFAELAGDAALFTGGISSEGVLATEARRDGALWWISVSATSRQI